MSKIIWAVDPWQNPEEVRQLVKQLRYWAKTLACDVQPVFVVPDLILPAQGSVQVRMEIAREVQKTLSRFLTKTGTKDFLSPVKITVSSLSTRKMAVALAEYADGQKGALIFCGTRAKKRINPFRLGGFAETLVAVSRIPVLLMNPRTKAPAKIRSVLFPTDLTTESKNALDRLELWLKGFGAGVTLYNQVEQIYLGAFGPETPGAAMALVEYNKEIEKYRRKKAESLAHQLRLNGVPSSVIVESHKKYISDAILSVAKKQKVHLVAMVNHAGQARQALIGGIARDVLMRAECPVLVFYKPKPLRKKKLFDQKRQLKLKSGDLKAIAEPGIVYHERP